jgi:hypothetical protein
MTAERSFSSFLVGWDKVAGEPISAAGQSQALRRISCPATAGPPTSAVGRELNIRGGPARGGTCLFSDSHLLHSEYLT